MDNTLDFQGGVGQSAERVHIDWRKVFRISEMCFKTDNLHSTLRTKYFGAILCPTLTEETLDKPKRMFPR